MPQYRRPGVYVAEIGSGVRPIAAVDTTTALFLGTAPGAGAPLRQPTFVTSFAEFRRVFAAKASTATPLVMAARGFFDNGGSRLWVVHLGKPCDALSPADLALAGALEGVALVAAPGYADPVSHKVLIADCDARGDRLAVLDCADGPVDPGLLPGAAGGRAAAYTPWPRMPGPLGGPTVTAPPSGHVCGAIVRSDTSRGVWKSPANLGLHGVLDLTHRYSDAEQDLLNPAGVNVLRMFRDGIRIWGARTRAVASSEWRYVAVRRLAIMLAQSIVRGTRWAVFEPNAAPLWAALRRSVEAFLGQIWRAGALPGATADESFFVKCGPETMTGADIDQGRLIMVIGFAPVRPAEFVVIRIVQRTSDSSVEEGD